MLSLSSWPQLMGRGYCCSVRAVLAWVGRVRGDQPFLHNCPAGKGEKWGVYGFFRRRILGSSVWVAGPKVSAQVSWAVPLLSVSFPPEMCAASALLLSFSVVIFPSLWTVQALGSHFEPVVCSSSYPNCFFVTRTKCSLCITLTSVHFSN